MFEENPLLAKFARVELSPEERKVLRRIVLTESSFAAHQEVVRTGDRPTRCTLVVDGVLATSKVCVTGKRQTTSFHIAGDIPDLFGLHLGTVDSDVRTVTPSVVAFIDHLALRDLCDKNPRIAAAFWRGTLVDAAIFREWCVNLGQRPALKRLAHLFCEIMARMEAAGLAVEGSCHFPVTQGDLCEATGLSLVHLNRTLQDLRASRLISFTAGELTIHDQRALAHLAEFTPGYLHLSANMAVPRAPVFVT